MDYINQQPSPINSIGLSCVSGLYQELTTLRVVLIVTILLLIKLYLAIRPSKVDRDLPRPTKIDEILSGSLDWSKFPTQCLELSRSLDFKTWGFPTPNIGFGGACFFILSEDNLRYVLRDNVGNYVKGGPGRKCTRELFGDVLFGADGDRWSLHRKVVMSMLSRDAVRSSADLILEKVTQVADVLDSVAAKTVEYEKERQQLSEAERLKEVPTIDIQNLFQRMTVDVAIDVAFDIDQDSVKSPEKSRQFFDALDELVVLLHERYFDIFYVFRQFFGLGRREKRIRELKSVIDDFADDIIKRIMGRRFIAGGGSDLLCHFMSYSAQNGDEEPPTKKELRNMVMNFVFAGRDSTAFALSWTIYELTKHPDIASRIIDEVEAVCGVGPNADYLCDKINSLDYTHAVVMESLRLHPPATDSWRMAVNDDILPDGTSIPAGSCVMYSPYTMNHSEKIWGDDVGEFNPDRFFGAGEPSAFKFPTFNAGPRICPGKSLALLEIKTAIAYLLPKFEFVDVRGHSGEYRWALVMSMKDGFHVSVKRRQ